MTRAPIAFPIWTPAEPTPPVAPRTTSVSPAFSAAVRRAPQASTPTLASAAASSKDTPAGIRRRQEPGTATASAHVPSRNTPRPPPYTMTRSPALKPAPFRSTMPDASSPRISGGSLAIGKCPIRTMPSSGLTADALMRTSTSSGPGSGSDKVVVRRTSKPPYDWICIAFMIDSFRHAAIGRPSAVSDPGCELDLDELRRQGQAGRRDDRARHRRPLRPVGLLPDRAGRGERRVHVGDVQDLLDDVLQGRTVPTQDLLGVCVGLPHLGPHVGMIEDLPFLVQRGRPNNVSFVVMAQLAGDIDRVAYPDRLGVPVQILPRHSEPFSVLAQGHALPPWSTR